MLMVETDRDTLLRPLQIVSGIVERRHTMPILSNILIRKDGENVSFLSSDVEVQITTRAAIGAGEHAIATTVGARMLLDILRALPDQKVSLTLDDKRMTVKSGKSRFNLQTLKADEFPTINVANPFSASFSLPQKTLKHLFSMVYFSMAHQDIRYYLNGLLLVVSGKRVIAVTTDGHRLAYCQANIDHELPHQQIIIPRKTILELQRLLDDVDDPVKIDIANNQIKLQFSDTELISKLVEGKFPDYNRVIPTGYMHHFSIDRLQLLHSLQRVAIMTSDKFKGIRCVVEQGLMKINSTNADQEDVDEEIEIDYSGDTIDMGFNVTYLLDVLNNIKTDRITVTLNNSSSSALITLPDDDDFKYVVMPMRI